MTNEEIKSYINEIKIPVKIHLSDGRSFTVVHTDFLIFHPVGDGIFLFQPDSSYVIINKHHITSIGKL